jgi:hypothetical protein
LATEVAFMQSMTSLPFFDINFNFLFETLTEGNKKLRIEVVDQNLDIIRKYFGLKEKITTLKELEN